MINRNDILVKTSKHVAKIVILSCIITLQQNVNQSVAQTKDVTAQVNNFLKKRNYLEGGTNSPSLLNGKKLLPPPRVIPTSQLHVFPIKTPKISRLNSATPRAKTVKREVPKPLSPETAQPAAAPIPSPVPSVVISPNPLPTKSDPLNLRKATKPEAISPNKNKENEIQKNNFITGKTLDVSQPPPAPKLFTTEKDNQKLKTTSPTEIEMEVAKLEENVSDSSSKFTLNVGRALRIPFDNDEIKVSVEARKELLKLADQIRDRQEFRLQLMAFAAVDGMSISKARRKSLSRALSVRSFLMKNGIRSTRIDVRALGDKTKEMPLNRVDINIAKR